MAITVVFTLEDAKPESGYAVPLSPVFAPGGPGYVLVALGICRAKMGSLPEP